jgi:hypothetical protein
MSAFLRPDVVMAPPRCLCVECREVFDPHALEIKGWCIYTDGRTVPEVLCPKCENTTRLVIAPRPPST